MENNSVKTFGLFSTAIGGKNNKQVVNKHDFPYDRLLLSFISAFLGFYLLWDFGAKILLGFVLLILSINLTLSKPKE